MRNAKVTRFYSLWLRSQLIFTVARLILLTFLILRGLSLSYNPKAPPHRTVGEKLRTIPQDRKRENTERENNFIIMITNLWIPANSWLLSTFNSHFAKLINLTSTVRQDKIAMIGVTAIGNASYNHLMSKKVMYSSHTSIIEV